METGWYFSKFRRSFLQKPDGKGTEIVVIFFNGLLMVKEDWTQLLLQVPWLDAIISSLKVPDFISVSQSNAPPSEHQVLLQGRSHAAFTFWTCTEVQGGKAFVTRREESLRGNGHYLPPGGGKEEIGESFWLCRITIFLDSLLRIWIGRQQSPLYVLPPFISPKTVWSPPQNPPTKCPSPPPPCSRGRWITSGGALQTYHNSLVNLLIPLNRTLNSKGQ